MGTLKISGRDARSTARKLPRTPPKQDTPSPIVDPAWGAVNEDPFTVDTDMTTELRASWLADAAICQQQSVEELASLARKLDRLRRKLQEPSLADNPHRPDAVRKAQKQESELIQIVRDMVMHEAHSDRVWQALAPEGRQSTHANHHWMTEETEDRLIGRTWFALATFEAWPKGFKLNRQWFRGLPLTVLMDLRTHRVYAWDPNPRPEFFPDEKSDPIPADLTRQIADGRGNPR